MASVNTRGQLVTDALLLAGRSSELKQSGNQWLNYFLRYVGLTFRFPELRKIGTPIQLAQGSQTATLPGDLGAGMEKQGLLFGPNLKPLDEKAYEEFATNVGFFQASQGTGLPTEYMVDLEAGLFRFNRAADVAYTFTPVYYKTPPLLPVETSSDNGRIWLDNDLIAVEGLIWMIYKYTEDPRESSQEAKVESMINKWKREVVKLGGTSRVLLSPARFKNVRVGLGS